MKKKKSYTFAKVIAWIFLTAAGLALCGALSELCHALEIKQSWSRAEGTITDVTTFASSSSGSRGRGGGRLLFYLPHVAFTAADGRRYEVRGHAGEQKRPRRASSYYRGKKVTVLYPPENPQKAMIHSWGELYSLSLVFLVFGLAAGAFGGVILFSSMPEHPRVKALKAWFREG